MEKFDELLKKLNDLTIMQESRHWAENLPGDIWNEYFKNYEEVASGLDVDTHRWYEISTTVINIFNRFLGISYITNMFSESSGYSDYCVEMDFFEMETITVTSYRIKGE